jgi:hypothetical protein
MRLTMKRKSSKEYKYAKPKEPRLVTRAEKKENKYKTYLRVDKREEE